MDNRDNRDNDFDKRFESRTKRNFNKGFKIFFAVLFGIGMAFLIGFLVMNLWNWLMPSIFGLPMIGYWQAIGVLVLAKILFGFGGGGPRGPRRPGRGGRNRRQFGCRNRSDFSEWARYDEFWENEGQAAFKNYVERTRNTER